jgi:hypothetical protein
MLGVAKRQIFVDLVSVPAPYARPGQVAGLLEVVDDLRRRSFRDSNGLRDIPQPRRRIFGDALEDVRVVCDEPPRMILLSGI